MEIDNLNISLQESPKLADTYKQQIFAKYLFLDKDLHDDLQNEDSLSNLQNKAKASQTEHLALETDIAKHSELIINYEFITILLIVAASLAGISEIAKNKILGYSALCIGGVGCMLLLLAPTTGITFSHLVIALTTGNTFLMQSENHSHDFDTQSQEQTRRVKQSIFDSSPSVNDTSSSVDLNKMYNYCHEYQTKIKPPTCDLLFLKYK